ncbi:uncharacterized protein FIBRA_00942 [Fibroporia radiculosa]|uniref:FAD/NAD(P)-binding domain-containing protein n=1 Tax=Fibroporia radiculosa TaxID=599839 RepID=J4GIZ8_9APHY|nr:uncharacterized protein FIBRA_00942 [Fibroporia radiculosa]CCL98935.1 predicted protein [Fibroporia radiculosa]
MVHFVQFILSFLPPLALWYRPDSITWLSYTSPEPCHLTSSPNSTKSIAIVGAGSAGLGVLKAILDLPLDIRSGWEVVLYERRRDVGGLWLPDPPGYTPNPPELPETPWYPLLRTNTPHPTMTYPHFPFAGGTTLFPPADAVQTYHADFAVHNDLTPYVRLNHTVVSAQWYGDDAQGNWYVEVQADGGGSDEVTLRRAFDHLIVASGHNSYPYIPAWNGTEDWLAGISPGVACREILHSIYYRRPERYANRGVLIVGSGASAFDIAVQVSPLAQVVYQSVKEGKKHASGAAVVQKPAISHFTRDSVVFVDGTAVTDVDAVILGTGYELRIPFLSAPHSSVLLADADTRANSTTAGILTSNLRYLFPLHRQIFSLASNLPPTALGFIGLPSLASSCPLYLAQGIFVAHTLANSSLLPTREDMVRELVAREERLRARGYDPYRVGHKLLASENETEDYQDELIAYLKHRGALPENGKPYVDSWRRMEWGYAVFLYRGWRRIQALDDEQRWLNGVETEEQWVDMMDRIVNWERKWEEGHSAESIPIDFYVETY